MSKLTEDFKKYLDSRFFLEIFDLKNSQKHYDSKSRLFEKNKKSFFFKEMLVFEKTEKITKKYDNEEYNSFRNKNNIWEVGCL